MIVKMFKTQRFRAGIPFGWALFFFLQDIHFSSCAQGSCSFMQYEHQPWPYFHLFLLNPGLLVMSTIPKDIEMSLTVAFFLSV